MSEPRVAAIESNDSSYPKFGMHSITFLGFLYASILSGTIPLLESTNDRDSVLMLFLLWFYLTEDWLLKYTTWRGIENISARFDLQDGVIEWKELKQYHLTCIANIFFLFLFLLLMVLSFYVQIHRWNVFMNGFVELLLGASLVIGWAWSIFVAKKYSLGSDKRGTIYWKSLTFRASLIARGFICSPTVSFGSAIVSSLALVPHKDAFKKGVTPMRFGLTIILCFAAELAFPQQWQYLGLRTESVTTIAIDWSNPDVIYAGSGSDYSSGTVGGVFKSTNAGATWDTLIRGVTAMTIAIHPTKANILYAALGVNDLTVTAIIKSTDAGTSWSKADSGVRMNWEAGPGPLVIDPTHPDTLYTGVAGLGGGGFYRSTNGGTNWTLLGDSTGLRNGVTAIAIHRESPNVLYAATEWICQLFKSTDHGESWSTAISESLGICRSIESTANHPSTFYVVSAATPVLPVCMFLTTDDGLTWQHPSTVGLPDTLGIYRMQVYDSATTQLFLVGRWQGKGGIFESSDGKPWKNINSDWRFETLALAGSRLYAGGAGVYVLDIPTSVSGDAPSHVKTFNLGNTFPNPFNPSTQIVYEIGNRSEVLLEVYDLQGRKVKTLVRMQQPSGTYSVFWDGRDERGVHVSSGVYFYVLRAREEVSAKKMIYLR